MCKSLNYLLFGILIFGIGTTFALYFSGEFQYLDRGTIEVAKSDQIESHGIGYGSGSGTATGTTKPESEIPRKQGQLTCTDKRFAKVWRVLKQDEDFKRSADELLYDADCSRSIDIRKIDLNGDGSKEILIKGTNYFLCSATGTCNFWVLQKNGSRLERILVGYDYSNYSESEKDSFIQVKETKTNGFFDIQLRSHFSGYETKFRTYEYNGKEYDLKDCSAEVFSMNGERSVLSCMEFDKR